ncbi:MAG TPA: cupin domain-containing protein [Prosthecobacter sp.]
MRAPSSVADIVISSVEGLPLHSVLGVDVRILAGAEETGGAYASYHARCAKGAGAPPHRHENADEAFFVLEGEFDILCGDRWRRARSGDHVFIPRGLVHGFTGASEASATLLGMCTPAGHEDFFRDAAALAASGQMQAEAVMALCARHHIELVMP